MNPYQQANEEQIRQRDAPSNLLRQGTSLALGVGSASVGGALAQRVLPLLSKYIPQDLAIKGLNKIDSRLGKFIDKALTNGKSFEEVKDFITEKAEPALEKRNIIEQESPELHQFLDQEIRKGRKPIEAAVIAQHDKKFTETIKKLMKKHKVGWSDIIQSIYGAGDMGLPQQQPSGNAGQPHPGSARGKFGQSALVEEAMNPAGSSPMRPPGAEGQAFGGRGLDPGVAQILQQGQALLQKFKGQP